MLQANVNMAYSNISQYLQEVLDAIASGDGHTWAELISFRHPHVMSPKLQVRDASQTCRNWFDPPLNDLVTAHLNAVWAVTNNDYSEAYSAQLSVVQNFIKFFQGMKDEIWALPVLYSVALDLRKFAMNADKQLVRSGRGKPNEKLESTADQLMSCFRVCVSDTRAPLEVSKKWGMLGMVNQLFKIYFKINRLQLCKPLIRAIGSLSIKNDFMISHLVTFRYFVGKKAMFDSDYKLADEYLTFAFERCHRACRKNKRLILIYLLPVKMQLGKMPSLELLVKYDLVQFTNITKAVSTGNLRLLNQALLENQEFFIKAGIYLILEKLKILTYRNLFKKTFLILSTHQLPIHAFLTALHYMGATDVDLDEVNCILANLIYTGYLKGYISYQHQKLVVSKQNAFPALSTLQ